MARVPQIAGKADVPEAYQYVVDQVLEVFGRVRARRGGRPAEVAGILGLLQLQGERRLPKSRRALLLYNG